MGGVGLGNVFTLCASSKAITRPTSVFCSRKRERHMLNRAHALSAVTQGQERSSIVRVPA